MRLFISFGNPGSGNGPGRGVWRRVIVGLGLLAGPSLSAFAQQEVSVNKFTGTAYVTIPLHTVVAQGGVALPLQLTYAATGVPVASNGGTVGMNWSVSSEPTIQREVRGLPDDILYNDSRGERRYGWLASGTLDATGASIDVGAKVAAVPAASTGGGACPTPVESTARTALGQFDRAAGGVHEVFDSEPDVFSYSIPGHSGKFVFDAQKRIRTIPYDPVTIRRVSATSLPLQGFEIITPEGHKYVFDASDRDDVTRSFMAQPSLPPHYLRDYKGFVKSWWNAPALTYGGRWHATRVEVPQLTGTTGMTMATAMTFAYELTDAGTSTQVARTLYLGTANAPQWLGTEESGVTSRRLKSITAYQTLGKTTLVELNQGQATTQVDGALGSLTVTALGNGQTRLVKRVLLEYLNASSEYYQDRLWYDENGNTLQADGRASRRFLREVRIENDCLTLSAYTFAYHGLTLPTQSAWAGANATTSLPPIGCVEQDYWGYYNGNRAQTLVPKLYVYPTLNPQTPPGGPYRLFAIPSNTNGFELSSGANRQAAQTPQAFSATTLAGTLTEITLPTGGKTTLDYDAHQFYDPASQTYPVGGGVRVRAVRHRDQLTGVEQVRYYDYEASAGASSGRLLHVPHFAITSRTAPDAQATVLRQWEDATLRATEDLAPDAFESRGVVYSRVIERVPGRGRSVFTYSLAALPDEAPTVAYPRTAVGLARQQYYNGSTYACPSVGLFEPGIGAYPFAQAANYNHERGNLLSVSHESEPNGASVRKTVQTESYTYGYVPAVAATTVEGVAYEQVKPDQGEVFAYGKYALRTDFAYALLAETKTVFDQARPGQGVATTTTYTYNTRGQLASRVLRNSDGSYLRTRYKYAPEFAAGTGAAGPRLTALRQRVNEELVTSDVLETVTEVAAPGTAGAKVTQALINTYTIDDGRTRLHQQYVWQPAAPVTTASASYDSTRIKTVGGAAELAVNGQARLTASVEQVSQQLMPTSLYAPTGRSKTALLYAFDGSSPKLKVQNARLSEVLFSDFETETAHDFNYASTVVSSTARTGTKSLYLSAGSQLAHALPESAAARYRLTFWTRNETGAATSVTVSVDGTPVATRTTAAGTDWQLHDVVLDLAALLPGGNRPAHQLRVSAGSALFVDDVLLVPALAAASSATYDLVFGKASETDARQQTTYYEYDPAGNEAQVLDHNKSIVRQVTKVVAGRQPAYAVDFRVEGDLFDQTPITFLAGGSCLNGASYAWRFTDAQSGQLVATASGATVSQLFSTGGQTKTYNVVLTVTAQGRQLTKTRSIRVEPGPWRVALTMCGATSFDACTATYQYVGCDNNPPAPTSYTTYQVEINNRAPCPSGFVYTWEKAYDQQGNWQAAGTTTVPQLVLPVEPMSYRLRCTVTACNRTGTTPPLRYTVNTTDVNGHQCNAVVTPGN